MSESSMQTTAAANALSSEKTFRTVNFAITGDDETDLIAGILAVVSESFRVSNHLISHQIPVRVLRYLLERYETNLRNIEKAQAEQREQWQHLQQGAVGNISAQPNQNPGGLGPYTSVVIPPNSFSGLGSACNGLHDRPCPPQPVSPRELTAFEVIEKLQAEAQLRRLSEKP